MLAATNTRLLESRIITITKHCATCGDRTGLNRKGLPPIFTYNKPDAHAGHGEMRPCAVQVTSHSTRNDVAPTHMIPLRTKLCGRSAAYCQQFKMPMTSSEFTATIYSPWSRKATRSLHAGWREKNQTKPTPVEATEYQRFRQTQQIKISP